MSAPVVTQGLTKRFRGGQVAVDGVDLEVPAGSVFGFLGPNGSGKTTTIRMMLGLISPTAGSVQLLGEPMPKGQLSVLPRVGALVEGPAFYPFWSGQANLMRFDAADRTANPRTRRARASEALERVGLANAAGKKVRNYSLGMRQRLAIAVALMQRRELLVLDEPTNGLDPQGTREVRGLIRELAGDGTTIFTSTHLLAEVEQVCTHAAVMSRGRLVRQSTVSELRAGLRPRLVVRTPDVAAALRTLGELGLTDLNHTTNTVEADLNLTPGSAQPQPTDLNLVPGSAQPQPTELDPASVVDPTNPADLNLAPDPAPPQPADLPIEQVAPALVAAEVRIHGLTLERPSLEEAFVALTGEGFDVAE